MNILLNILVAVLSLIFGYLIGSANISIPLGKLIFKQDPRDYGSHNCGATNCGRIWGKKYFFIVFFFDVFKTVSPLYICWAILTFVPFNNGMPLLPNALQMYNGEVGNYLIQWPIYWVAPIGSLLGGIFPLFTGFRGGKAVSNLSGLILTTTWFMTIFGVIAFFGTLFKSKYVSLSSIVTGIVLFVCTWVYSSLITFHVIPLELMVIFQYGPLFYFNYVFAIVITIQATVMIIRHHENINRLRAGNEKKVKWIKSKEKVEN